MAASDARHHVRPSRPDDVGDVLAIEERCFQQPNAALLMRLCGVTDTLLVCERAGAVAGYVLAAPTSATAGRVISLAVAPAYRERGVGSALMAETLDLLAGKGIDEVELETRVSNDAAMALYEKFGFTVVGRKPGYYDDGEDAYLMRTWL